LVLEHHPNRPLPHLGGVLFRSRHDSNLSKVGASGKPRAVHLILPPRTFAPSKRRENSLVSFKAGGTAVGRSSPPGHAKVPWRRCLHIALPRLSPSPPRLVASGYDHRVLSLGLSVE